MRLLLIYTGGAIGVVLLLTAWIALAYLAVDSLGPVFNNCPAPGPGSC